MTGMADHSLTDAAYQAIKDLILTNRLKPGEAVPKDRLIRELKLSRTPLREAMLRLEKEGFVTVRPRMGTFVSQLDLRQIQEMYQVRRALEGLAGRLAAGRVERAKLERVETDLRRQRVEGRIDCAALSESGQGLHRLIVESCGNKLLAAMIQSLQDHFRRFRALSLEIPEKVLASHREHLAIAAALREGDGTRAQKLVEEHFEHAGRSLVESLLQGGAKVIVG
jgi:DNA-binding GntR family transcriptional regulator